MNSETLTALLGSIEKWEAIVAGITVDQGPKNCPLCWSFYSRRRSCSGCPVSERSGQILCRGTPYQVYATLDELPTSERARLAATNEVKFLRSLLPPDHPDYAEYVQSVAEKLPV